MLDSIHGILDSLLDKKLYEYGLADIRGLLPEPYTAFHTGISIIRRLDRTIIDAITSGPTRDYLNHYRAVNDELARAAESVENELCRKGLHDRSVRPTFYDIELDDSYLKTLRAPVSHKMIATRAGMGWIGKTDLLVTFSFGPRVRLASVLVEEDLPGTGTPVKESQCGSCTICVDSCPGGAANGGLWKAGMDREEFFDAFKCREACRKLSYERLDEEISLCGICVALCPRGHDKKNIAKKN